MHRQSNYLLFALGAAIALFVYTRSKQGSAALDSVANTVGSAAIAVGEYVGILNRGLRDNNPGNVRRSSDSWQGALSRSDVEGNGGTWDSAFVQFSSIGYGIRAMSHVLQTYYIKYGLNTVRGIVSRYAPPQDGNDTESYINRVATYMELADDERFDVQMRLQDLVTAMMIEETGYRGDPLYISEWVYA